MRSVKINEAETIFEPYWDSGESYPDHHKYTCLSQYRVGPAGAGETSVNWCSVRVALTAQEGDARTPFCMERDCKLRVAGYDRLILFACVPQSVEFRLVCAVDGREQTVLSCTGKGKQGEYAGEIRGEWVTGLRLEFTNTAPEESVVDLSWMGLQNTEKKAALLARESPYTPDWEGCFSGEIEMKPQLGVFFDEKGLEAIREKVKTPGFKEAMDHLRERAQSGLTIEPERYVGEFCTNHDYRWVREEDRQKPELSTIMSDLAFVGLVDEDPDMLKMACRMALTLAHSTYFCESIMGVFPGAAWHHRSFFEAVICSALVRVLDWAGSLLSWHGKNVIHDAMIMKGLPRMDADVKTMDYIWKMNQGPDFTSGIIITLLALSRRFPRYIPRIDEAERDLLSMWDQYVFSDGGSGEGPNYWRHTLCSMSDALYLLARYHGMSIAEYLPASVRKSALFGEALFTDDGYTYVPVNDADVNGVYSRQEVGLLAAADAGNIWRSLNDRLLDQPGGGISDVIWGKRYGVTASKADLREFISLPVTGHTTLRRQTEDVGTVSLHAVSGAIVFGHAHGDKGSLLLEADETPLLIDRGRASYSGTENIVLEKSERHNVVTAVKDGIHLTQETEDPACGAAVLRSEYENGVFTYETDVAASWKGVFHKNVRRITSDDPHRYVVEDELEIDPEYEICFVLNTYGQITETDGGFLIEDGGKRLAVIPRNWRPDKVEAGPYGRNGNGRPVNRLCLYRGGAEHCRLTTELILSREG